MPIGGWAGTAAGTCPRLVVVRGTFGSGGTTPAGSYGACAVRQLAVIGKNGDFGELSPRPQERKMPIGGWAGTAAGTCPRLVVVRGTFGSGGTTPAGSYGACAVRQLAVIGKNGDFGELSHRLLALVLLLLLLLRILLLLLLPLLLTTTTTNTTILVVVCAIQGWEEAKAITARAAGRRRRSTAAWETEEELGRVFDGQRQQRMGAPYNRAVGPPHPPHSLPCCTPVRA
jgi:hypothetical protein